jgi:hypothetical protein
MGDLLYNIKFPDVDRRDELFPQSESAYPVIPYPVRVSIFREEISAGSLAEAVNELQAAEPFKILHEMMKR